MDNKLKTGLISIAALIGGYSFFTKKTKYSMDAETFMASRRYDGKERARAINKNKINNMDAKFTPFYTDTPARKWLNKNIATKREKIYNLEPLLVGKDKEEFTQLQYLFRHQGQYTSPNSSYGALLRDIQSTYRSFKEKEINNNFDKEEYRRLIKNLAEAIDNVKDEKYMVVLGYNAVDARKLITDNEEVQKAQQQFIDFVRDIDGSNSDTSIVAAVPRAMLSNKNSLLQMNSNLYYIFGDIHPIENTSDEWMKQLDSNINRMNGQYIRQSSVRQNLLGKERGNILPVADIKEFADYLLTGTPNQYGLKVYVSIVYWNEFFKANPSITFVGEEFYGDASSFYNKENIYSKSKTLYPVWNWTETSKSFSREKVTNLIDNKLKRYVQFAKRILSKEEKGEKKIESLKEELDKSNFENAIKVINERFADKTFEQENKQNLFNVGLSMGNRPLHFNNLSIPIKYVEQQISPGGRVSYEVKDMNLTHASIYSKEAKLSYGVRPNPYFSKLTIEDLTIPQSLKDAAIKMVEIQFNHRNEGFEQQIENLQKQIVKNEENMYLGIKCIS